jgi:hypothetical protein
MLERIWEEPTRPGSPLTFGAAAYPHISDKAAQVLRDQKLEKPGSANGRIKTLRHLFAWAIADEVVGIEINPTREVGFLPRRLSQLDVDEVERFEARYRLKRRCDLRWRCCSILAGVAQRLGCRIARFMDSGRPARRSLHITAQPSSPMTARSSASIPRSSRPQLNLNW